MINKICYVCKNECYDKMAGNKLHHVNNFLNEFACDTCLYNDHTKCGSCKKYFHTDYLHQQYKEIDLYGYYCDRCAHQAAQSILESIEAEEDLHSWYHSQCVKI